MQKKTDHSTKQNNFMDFSHMACHCSALPLITWKKSLESTISKSKAQNNLWTIVVLLSYLESISSTSIFLFIQPAKTEWVVDSGDGRGNCRGAFPARSHSDGLSRPAVAVLSMWSLLSLLPKAHSEGMSQAHSMGSDWSHR